MLFDDLSPFIHKVLISRPNTQYLILQTYIITPKQLRFHALLRINLEYNSVSWILYDKIAGDIMKNNFPGSNTSWVGFSDNIISLLEKGGEFSFIPINNVTYRYSDLSDDIDHNAGNKECAMRDYYMEYPTDEEALSFKLEV